MASQQPGSEAGFTLLEVIVALAVVSLGIIAAFNLVVQIGSGSLHMKERTFASWVASNEVARIRLGGEFPEVSEFDGDVEFAGIEYRWRATVSETGVENLRRIDLTVAYADQPDAVIASSLGFIGPPATPRLGGASWAETAGGRSDGGEGAEQEGDANDDSAGDRADDGAREEDSQ